MKLLAQFYACLAIIVFIAVIGGIEARNTRSVGAVNRGASMTAQAGPPQGPPPGLPSDPSRNRRHSPTKEEIPKQAADENEEVISRYRRHTGSEKDIPKKPEVNEEPEKHHLRTRRQMPGGGNIPIPEDFPKEIPRPLQF